MHVYIDESGNFIPLNGERSRVSTLAALVIPSSQRDRLFDSFVELREKLRPGCAELHGRELSENEIAAVLRLLARFGAIAELCAIDIGNHRDEDVSDFKTMQAEKLLNGLPEKPSQELREDVERLAQLARTLPNQLFVQGWMTVLLIEGVLDTAINYHAQRHPQELQAFNWVIDAKGIGVTPGEEFWTSLIFPALQTRSHQQPAVVIPWGDFSHFQRFLVPVEETRCFGGEQPDETDSQVSDLSLLLTENLQFSSSSESLGLQMVDVVANAAARALNERLQEEGWIGLGKLLVARRPQALQFVMLRSNPDQPERVQLWNYHGYVSERLQEQAKGMVPAKFLHLLRSTR